MKTFIFENYGYYPEVVSNESFYVNNWIFTLKEVEFSEKEIIKLNELCLMINNIFNGNGSFFVKNRKNEYVSMLNGRKYVLWTVKNNSVNRR